MIFSCLLDSLPRPRRHSAFSLVEVTLALGLISFAVVTILALIPSGLAVLRSSMDQSLEAQIVKGIGARSILSSFDNVAVKDLYFDEEGQETALIGDARFYVSVETETPEFPGSDIMAAGQWQAVAKTLRIEVVRKPTPTASGTTNFHTLMVANSGH